MDRRRIAKELLIKTLEALLLCNILILVNILIISYLVNDAVIVLALVSEITLLEGGVGLAMGGLFVLGAGPSATKVSEKAFHGPSYSTKRAREAEGRARLLIFYSAFLILFSYLLSL
ncbi:MAG: hypothetical protein WED04_10900 [Promethearchaeati archaeon SRVP18_Atabeyarchaeia-1]